MRAPGTSLALLVLGCSVDPWTPPSRNPEAGVTAPDAAGCGELRRCCTGPAGASPCPAGLVCQAGRCGECPSGTQACEGTCVDLASSAHCGRCGNACPAGLSCAREGTTAACRPAPCGPGLTRCGDACVNLTMEVAHCGACGNRCALSNAVPACAAGVCRVGGCMPGFADCDTAPSNGCEANTGADLAHCGGCNRMCTLPSAVAQCAAGRCGLLSCAPGFGDCDGVASNGCEVPLRDTLTHCGRCGNRCAFPNAAVQCVAGECRAGACNTGFADCNLNPADGCETDLRGTTHCGRCDQNCAPGEVCDSGTCSLRCPGTQTACGGACVFLERDPLNCGACGTRCPSTNGTALCMGRLCTIACAEGFGDCDGMAANGCESNFRADPQHCGRCGNRCAFPNAAGACLSGTCAVGVCAPGFGNCDGMAANGCESNLRESRLHCGGCGNECPLGRTCMLGMCAP